MPLRPAQDRERAVDRQPRGQVASARAHGRCAGEQQQPTESPAQLACPSRTSWATAATAKKPAAVAAAAAAVSAPDTVSRRAPGISASDKRRLVAVSEDETDGLVR